MAREETRITGKNKDNIYLRNSSIFKSIMKDFIKFLRRYDLCLTFGFFFKCYDKLRRNKNYSEEMEKGVSLNYLKFLNIENNFVLSKSEFKKIKLAYSRACHNRDYEIDKFWSRAAYFWTFIALTFGGYYAFITFNSNLTILNEIINSNKFVELYLICLGLIFSFAWKFVILGSKQWQENWEKHIENLEDYVTGKLFKTVFRKGKFYSVSKINLVLSNIIILTWIIILISYLYRVNANPEIGKAINWQVLIPILFTIYIILQFMFGYGRSSLKNSTLIELE